MIWSNTTVKLKELKPWEHNPRQSTKKQAHRILESFDKFGQVQVIAIGPNKEVYDGHQRLSALLTLHGAEYQVDARMCERELTEAERQALVITLHAGAKGEWDWDTLANWDIDAIIGNGLDTDFLKELKSDSKAIELLLKSNEPPTEDAEPQIDRAEELREKWGVELGQMWQLGDHRIICGDCTDKAVVDRVMMGEKAALLHADPPYGMGKENEGIENDNLYREKLDIFQMEWWKACRPSLIDNGSAYIWGNAENLWRLWYKGGLKDSERFTFRNEIVWNKQHAEGMLSDRHRMYATASERCLFFMLGEQGFDNNADNYWEGWEPIRLYLEQERKKAGWDIPEMKRAVGHSDLLRDHWTSKSQWNFPTQEVYERLQKASGYNAFKRDYDELKRDYDELKRDFYSTRAYFNNTHDGMTDVWEYSRLTGNDRYNHATPKPVEMMERVIKTSTQEKDIVIVPFDGTAPELIACENLGRKCRAIEISPAYVAVAIQRWVDVTGKEPVML